MAGTPLFSPSERKDRQRQAQRNSNKILGGHALATAGTLAGVYHAAPAISEGRKHLVIARDQARRGRAAEASVHPMKTTFGPKPGPAAKPGNSLVKRPVSHGWRLTGDAKAGMNQAAHHLGQASRFARSGKSLMRTGVASAALSAGAIAGGAKLHYDGYKSNQAMQSEARRRGAERRKAALVQKADRGEFNPFRRF